MAQISAPYHSYDAQIPKPEYPSATNSIVYSLLVLYVIHQVLVYFNYPLLSPQELVWNALVRLTPTRLLLDAQRRQELRDSGSASQMNAAKGEALRRMLGSSGSALSSKLVGGEGLMRSVSNSIGLQQQQQPVSNAPVCDAPPGLGNWDNSCYQNSVLQGLASLEGLKTYLGRSRMAAEDAGSTTGSLLETVGKLNDAANNGRQLWTPAKLKSMSSWQQQDAQEYFSKIMDELDKEAAKASKAEEAKLGLENAVAEKPADPASNDSIEDVAAALKNPMEGLLAQRVACTSCGFSEGLSMIPFNCLTVPLGSEQQYDIEQCLDEYTKLEDIEDVECAKCTLLRAETQLKQMLPPSEESTPTQATFDGQAGARQAMHLPPEVRLMVQKRLQAIEQALEEDDFADATLTETCKISKKAHVSSTKTRQAVIGRAPQSLVVHVNRSVFDELTGVQRKNYAMVRYPMVLNLGEWMLGAGSDGSATMSMLHDGQDGGERCLYRLKAVVTHYGRHENGHYISYRRHPLRTREQGGVREQEIDGIDGEEEERREQWWRLSDEDVIAVSEEDVLGQGGVFMLFYEREAEVEQFERPATAANAPVSEPAEAPVIDAEAGMVVEEAVAVPLPADLEEHDEAAEPKTPSPVADTGLPSPPPSQTDSECPPTGTTTEDESGAAGSTLRLSQHDEERPSTGTTTEDEFEQPAEPPQVLQKPPTPLSMRTARGRQSSRRESRGDRGFGAGMRPMAAT